MKINQSEAQKGFPDNLELAPGLRKLDYLSFTVHDKLPHEVMDRLDVPLIPVPNSRFGYRQMAISESGGISVMWDGAGKGMGVHVQISGQGCQQIEHLESFDNWRDWIGGWQELGAKTRRIDLAIDDISGSIQFETVYKQIRKGIALTRAERGRQILDWDKSNEYPTVYVGKRDRETMMRCYDKGQQLREGRSWLRFEFEYKRAKAQAIASCLVSEGWDAAIGAARSFIEFKDETDKEPRKSRQRPCAF